MCSSFYPRPSQKLYGVKKIVNTQAEILGFDIHSIRDYAGKLLHNPEQVEDLIKQAQSQHIFELLKIPMILLVTTSWNLFRLWKHSRLDIDFRNKDIVFPVHFQMVCLIYIDESEKQGKSLASLPDTASKIFEVSPLSLRFFFNFYQSPKDYWK